MNTPQENVDSKPEKSVSAWIKRQKSENWAGYISLGSSTALMVNADPKSVVAAILFTGAEVTLARYGHTSLGYSIAASLFVAGDVVLATNIEDNPLLEHSLYAMAIAWGVGAARYPLEQFSEISSETLARYFKKAADTAPAITGSLNLALRLPGVVSGAIGGNYIEAGAIAGWGVADILAGRLQEKVRPLIAYGRRQLGFREGHTPQSDLPNPDP